MNFWERLRELAQRDFEPIYKQKPSTITYTYIGKDQKPLINIKTDLKEDNTRATQKSE